jgi:hypothetical protein
MFTVSSSSPTTRLKTARRALRLAGGEWEKVRQRQVHTHRYSPDEGWASYCGKGLHMASPFVRELLSRHGSPELLISYTGNPLFVSRELGQRARTLFDATRLAMLWKLPPKRHHGSARRRAAPL